MFNSDYGGVELEFGDKLVDSSISKDAKYKFDTNIYDIIGWDVDIYVDSEMDSKIDAEV